MNFFTTLITSLLCLATTSLAEQSKPFYLVLHSTNETLDGKALFSCHEGAALEGACVGTSITATKPLVSTYQFNTTGTSPNQGLLTFELVGGNFKESQPMSLTTDPSTNVALVLFGPGDCSSTYVSFDASNRLYIASDYDDTVYPPKIGQETKLYRWFACEYNFEGYLYNNLCWADGVAKPQNPTCQSVGVERVFKK